MTKRATTMVEGTETEVLDEPTRFDEFFDHEKKAVQEFGKAFMALLPEGVREHGENAIQEMVEGYRRLFNATLDDIAKTVEKVKLDEKHPDKKNRVPIQ
ncbi:MAG: hypothetical protein K8L97_26205 [Anaerolineae bacterium]|nr:hypothetical protein [Anaerolineae bacterium]